MPGALGAAFARDRPSPAHNRIRGDGGDKNKELTIMISKDGLTSAEKGDFQIPIVRLEQTPFRAVASEFATDEKQLQDEFGEPIEGEEFRNRPSNTGH